MYLLTILRSMVPLCPPWFVFASVLLASSSGTLAESNGEDTRYQFDRYSKSELEAVCEAISPSAYASGMLDGAWFSLPGAGRTYYYRSACYMELVRRTGRAEVCPKVVERRSLLGDGSSYTPKRYVELAEAFNAREKQNAVARASLAQSVAGAFKVSSLKVFPLANQNWRIEVCTEGTRTGDYVLEFARIRDRKVLYLETHTLTQPQTFVWELKRATIVGDTPLPNIFPMAVSMISLRPATAYMPAGEHIAGIQNFTLSAQ